jgi:hypothetical protein
MNIVELVQTTFDRMFRERVFIAIVTGTSGSLVTVKRLGQSAADTQSYPKLDSYSSPTADDEVEILKVGSGWIVQGKVTR